MYLRRIELSGFKSFADRMELELEKGLTAIVGPNGSGKSNLVEAVRWALGEAGPRQLRSERLEECLFAGGADLRPGGMAEVILTIAGEGFERRLGRRYFRTGESEYLLDDRPVRRKDLLQASLALGLGVEGYFFVGQGRVEEILTQSPSERRLLLEEAAGLSLLRQRQAEVERELRETELTVQRLGDVRDEVASRLEPLREELERVERGERLEREVRNLAVGLELRTLAGLRERLVTLTEKGEAIQQGLAQAEEERARLAEMQLRLEERARRLKAAQERLEERSERLGGALRDRREELIRLEERYRFLRAAEEESARTMEGLHERLRKLQAEAAGVGAAAGSLQGEIAALAAEEAALRERLESAESSFSGPVPSPEQIAFWESELADLEARRIEVGKRGREISERLPSLERELDALGAEVAEMRKRSAKAEAHRRDLREEMEGLQQALRRSKTAAVEALGERNRLAERFRRLVREERNRLGHPPAVTALLQAAREGRLAGIMGAVRELLRVEPGYEAALAAALGGAVHHVVVADEASLKKAIGFLRERRLGRVTFLSLDLLRPRPAPPVDPAFLGRALSFCRYPAEAGAAFTYLLGSVLVAPDLETALVGARRLPSGTRIVTLAGEHILAGGPVTGGGGTEAVSSTRHREVLLGQIRKAQAAWREAERRRRLESDRLDALRERLARETEAGRGAELEYGEALRAEKTLAGELLLLREEEARLRQEEATLGELAAELEGRIAEGRRLRRAAPEGTGEWVLELRTALATTALRKEALLERWEENRRREERVRAEAAELEASLATAGKMAAERHRELDRLRDGLERLRGELPAAESHHGELHLLVERAGRMAALLGRMERAATAFLTRAERRKERLQLEGRALEAETSGLRSEVQNREEGLRDRYGLGPDEEVPAPPPGAEAVLAAKRLELETLGPINRAVRKEYAEVSERHRFLSRQMEDLLGARAGLGRLLDEMGAQLTKAFREVKERVDEELRSIFAHFFPGGRAYLSEGQEGVEIMAELPGKRQSRLGALSGGERTLTALAFLLALLSVRPSPFYILDEVEAALDEANAARLAAYLSSLEDRQLLMVTHQRPTMEAARQVYGVTVNRRGQSQVVAVRLLHETDVG